MSNNDVIKENLLNQRIQEGFEKYDTAWCPGCGNFAIQSTLQKVLNEMGFDPHKVLFAAGIGQAAKTPQYMSGNRFCGLHGRSLPAASAAKIANDELTVIINTGDGDSFGEGGNHFMAAVRRNVNITHIAHDNQVYGLTKGQASPTAPKGQVTSVQTGGVRNTPFNPVFNALALGAGFVARAFSGDAAQFAQILKEALEYDGYALIDIFQPCVSFNKINTFQWYKERVRPLGEDYDPTDFAKALETSQIFSDDGIPTGIIYKRPMETFKSQNPVLSSGTPLYKQGADRAFLDSQLQAFA